MSWDNILNDSNFQKEPDEVKIKVAENYFDQNIGSSTGYQAETPEAQTTVKDNFMATVRPKDTGLGAVRPERTVGGTLQDIAVTGVKGVAGVYEAAVGLADIPTFGYAGKLLEQTGADPGSIQRYLDTLLSPAQQAAGKEVAEAEGFLPTIQAALENPSVIAQTIGESLPAAVTGGLAAKALLKGTKLTKYAGAVGEGAIMTGSAAETLRAESETGLLGVGDIAASLALGVVGGAIGLAGQKLANKMGLSDIDALAAGVDMPEGGMGIIQRVIGGGIVEGVFEELPQSIQETVFMNAAQGNPLLEGVGESAAMGLLAGMGMGAGVNVFTGRGKEQSESALGTMLEKIVDEKALSPGQAKSVMFGFNEFATDEMTPDEKLGLVEELVNEELNKPEAIAERVQQLVDQQANVDDTSDPNVNKAPLWKTGELARSVRVQAILDKAPDATQAQRVEKDIKVGIVNTLDTLDTSNPMVSEVKSMIEDEILKVGAPLTEEVAPVGPDVSPKTLAYGGLAAGLGIDVAGKSAAEIETEVKAAVGLEEEIIDLPEAEIMTGETVETTRRKDTARRKEIDRLFDEGNVAEAERMIFEDPMTGALNRRAFEFDEQAAIDEGKSFASIDMSGLKWVNDTFGHDFGDGLLKLMGEGLVGIEGANTYRLGGDEYVSIVDNPEEAAMLLDTVKEQMKNKELVVTLPDGTVQTFKGWSFDYGTGQTYKEADANLTAQREELSAKGQRVGRGGRPVGLTQVVAKGVEGRVERPEELEKPAPKVEAVKPVVEKVAPVKKPKVISPEQAQAKVEAGDFTKVIEDKGWAPGSVRVALRRAAQGKILASQQQEIVDTLTGKSVAVAPKVEEKVAPVKKKKVLTAKTATRENLVVGTQFRLPGVENAKNVYEIVKVDGDYLDVKGVAGPVEGETETFTRGDITGEEIAFKREEKIEGTLPAGELKGVPKKADIVAVVDIITKDWKKKPKTEFVKNIDGLPNDIKGKIDAASADAKATKIPAFYDPKTETVYFLTDNIDSYDGIIDAIAHEMFGHFGLRRTLGKRIRSILNQVYIKHREAAQAVAIDYGFDLSTEVGRQRAAEEVLSNLARENKDPGLLKKVYAMIRDFFRSLGLVKEITDNDLRTLLANASEYVREGNKILTFLGSDIIAIADGDVKSVRDLKIVFKREQTPVQDQTDEMRRKVDAVAGEATQVVKKFWERNFTKEGLLNKVAFEQKLNMEAEMNLGESDIEVMVTDLNKAVKKAYGKKYSKVPKVELDKVNAYLSGDKGISLPAGLKEHIDSLRSMIDVQSDAMLKTIKDLGDIAREKLSTEDKTAYDEFLKNRDEGYPPKAMQKWLNLYDTINNNKGTYLNRSYQAFDDPKWDSKVRKKKGVIKRAEDFIRAQNPDFNDGEVRGAVGAILQNAKESTSLMSMISKGSKVGSKDVSITQKKKDVPKEIMDLLGVYTDPKINFTRSVAKMQYYVANHNFLMGLRGKGLNNFLYEKPTDDFTAQVAGKDSETMNPLHGLYSTPDFKQGMVDAMEGFEGSDIMRTVIKMNSFLKYGKTILSPTTQARNFISAYMFTVMNGHFNMKHMAKAMRHAKSDIFSHDKKYQEYLDKLKKNGVLHDNPYSGELRDALNDFADSAELVGDSGWKWLAKMAQKTYQVGDDFWKIIGYENEVAGQLAAGLSQAEAEKKAAYRIRNGYPTYSMVPRGIKMIRRWPLIGTFVSFPYEIIRTTKNQLEFIREDMKDPKTRPMAIKRMLGFAIASSATYAGSLATMAMMGMDADDDEAIRAQLPDWSRNSQLAYWGFDKDGLPQYLDMSFMDPYTYLKKPLIALANNNNKGLAAKIEDSLKEFLEPFIGADIGAAALGELIYNQKATGGEVYNPEDTGFRKANDILQHIRKTVQPGLLSNTEKTIMALGGEVSRSGKTYSIGDEAWAWAGFRFGTLNLNQSMNYKGYGFRDRKTKSTRILNRAIGSAATVSDRQINNAVSSMITARNNAYKDMIGLVKGSRQLGVKVSDIVRSLRASGVSQDDIRSLIKGRTPRWEINKDFLRAATERALVAAPNAKRKRELRAEMRHRKIVVAKALREVYRKK